MSLDEFREQMEGIYSTCVTSRTLDESPMAYKSMDDIIVQIRPTVDVEKRIVPIFNFKA